MADKGQTLIAQKINIPVNPWHLNISGFADTF
jgi:hypothetical protein